MIQFQVFKWLFAYIYIDMCVVRQYISMGHALCICAIFNLIQKSTLDLKYTVLFFYLHTHFRLFFFLMLLMIFNSVINSYTLFKSFKADVNKRSSVFFWLSLNICFHRMKLQDIRVFFEVTWKNRGRYFSGQN